MIRLHNTLTGNTQEFVPLQEGKVTLYTCGPTVYNSLTVGNWIAYLRWDTLVRALRLDGFYVERVMNITDVGHLVSDADEGEDKMIKGAAREGITEWEVASRYTDEFLKGMSDLNLVIPQHITKATEHIPSQIALIQTLERKGYTYLARDGVYYDSSKFARYASFAKLDVEGLRAGARITMNDDKKNPSDFVLWRLTPSGETRTMEWDSPWGKGMPGWHIECSAMAMQYLGSTIDIHTGGIDHIPVHHTNEIAQSEAASGQQFARYWLHANFLMSDGKKIAKSLGNGYTLNDLYDKGFSSEDFRIFALQSHYRTESNFTWDNLSGAHNRFKHWRDVSVLRWQMHDTIQDDEDKHNEAPTVAVMSSLQKAVDALKDDLNTPLVLKYIEAALSVVEQNHAFVQQDAFESLLDFIEEALGVPIRQLTPDIDEDLKRLLVSRSRARDAKDWSTSDDIRDQLKDRGIIVNDGASQTWVWA